MSGIFTVKDKKEGKVGIGKVPKKLEPILDKISEQYLKEVPDKDASTYHTWYDHMTPEIKSAVEQIQKDTFWNELCDNTENCIMISASEMDELYYSNPKNNLNKINLYGAAGNYDIHRDCIYDFNGIKFYRVIIGLTNGNDNIVTHFNNLNVSRKMNKGDYIAFDFDKSSHQVIKESEKRTPRILLKIHFIVCEKCKYSRDYVERIKGMYLKYEFVTRYIMQVGTDPSTFYQFFFGIMCMFFMSEYAKYIVFLLIGISLLLQYKTKFIYKNITKISLRSLLFLISSYVIVVFFYWSRYKLTGIR